MAEAQKQYRVFFVCYRQKVADQQKLENLLQAIKETDGWAMYFDSVWFLATKESARSIWNRLEHHIAQGDYLLISLAGKEKYGTLPPKAWKWFESVDKANLQKGG